MLTRAEQVVTVMQRGNMKMYVSLARQLQSRLGDAGAGGAALGGGGEGAGGEARLERGGGDAARSAEEARVVMAMIRHAGTSARASISLATTFWYDWLRQALRAVASALVLRLQVMLVRLMRLVMRVCAAVDCSPGRLCSRVYV